MAAYHHEIGRCAACGRTELLKKGYCRLCWCQAVLERPTGPNTPLLPYVKLVRHHQLFFAFMTRRRAAPKPFARRRGAKGRPVKPAPPAAARPVLTWLQPPLFEDVIPRRYQWDSIDLRAGPPPENPWLAYGLHLAHTLAETRGFGTVKRLALQHALVMLLAAHRDGEMIRATDFCELLRRHGNGPGHVLEVLAEMDVLIDDRAGTFDGWLTDKLQDLPAGISSETERWARTLRTGGPRMRPRDAATVRIYLANVLPALREWSSYDHLREVTRDDVLAHLDTLVGPQRNYTMGALRSLFSWAKTNGVTFRNPTSRIRLPGPEEPLWQPLTAADLAPTIEAATVPHVRVCVVLAAVHAARHGEIRRLQLDDVDFANRRLRIAGHDRPMDDLTHRVLTDWLDYRRQRWPNTANRHLLISKESAVNLGPVSPTWVGPILRGLPATLERLRIDRKLEEALTHSADPLHLAVVFGMHATTAVRYAHNARQLLQQPPESDQAASLPTRTRASSDNSERGEHSGSR